MHLAKSDQLPANTDAQYDYDSRYGMKRLSMCAEYHAQIHEMTKRIAADFS